MFEFQDVSFGAISAVLTSLAVIIGLGGAAGTKLSIIAALLIIAVVDNITDSFGIHVHQEAECNDVKKVRKTTLYNFTARLVITAIFILFVIVLPFNIAIILSIILGFIIIILLSHFISKRQKTNPFAAVLQHLALALIIVVASFFLRAIILRMS